MSRTSVIVGAGPAGLTCALELLRRTDVRPVIFEIEGQVGGISRTITYSGNRMDLGGHRFFSKSDWVMNWWQSMMPVEGSPDASTAAVHLKYQGRTREFSPTQLAAPDCDRVLLVRSRLSRIFYRRKFFDYPLKLSRTTLANLGAAYAAAVGASYLRARLAPRVPELTLEDFLVNRFGDKLYRTFFKDYTEKVWGVPCSQISAAWGAQRIKGLSITKALKHALLRRFEPKHDTSQKSTETSLIERFLYPKHGPGQMWETVADHIRARGGEIHLRHEVVGIYRAGMRVTAVDVRDERSGEVRRVECRHLISTMPIKELAEQLKPEDPEVVRIAGALPYRDFMTAGLLVRRMRVSHPSCASNGMPPDNWIYVQEPDVRLGRLQVFNNWSPALVSDPKTIWLGLEYFCDQGDDLWTMSDRTFLEFASRELAQIGLVDLQDVLDGTVVRVPKAYPAYFGAYSGIRRVQAYLDELANVFPIGRNGMHRYNNQDHSMLAAKAAADCIANGSMDKSVLWAVNAESEYHEEISGEKSEQPLGRAA